MKVALFVNDQRVEVFRDVWGAMVYARREFLVDWNWRPDLHKPGVLVATHFGTESKTARITPIR